MGENALLRSGKFLIHKSMQVSLFNGFTDKNPKPITIREVVEIIRADQRLQVLTENHRRYRAAGDTARADAEKQHMPCFSVAVQFSGGKQQKHITAFTGMGIVDLDHVKPEDMPRVLALVRQDSHTLLAYTTISNHGVRVLYRYAVNSKTTDCTDYTDFSTDDNNTQHSNNPRNSSNLWLNNQEYRRVFVHGNRYYSELVGMESDGQCKNATRLSGMAHDPEVYYNPEAVAFVIEPEEKRPVGRPRRVERLKMKVESCEAAVLRELEQRGVVYGPGTHNKYISDACYMMNRYGVTESDCTAWALERFSNYHEAGNDVASIVRSCYTQTEEHGTERLPRDESNVVSDIEEFLRSQGEFRRNVITGFPEIRYLNGCWQQFTDDDRNSLWRELSKRLRRKVLRQDISAVVKSDFSPKYNAFEEYVNRLQPWDGVTDHIARLASSVTVKGDQEYFARCFKKWLVAFIAAIFDAEEVNHEILVFIGRQGSYKSTWFHYLLPPELRQYFLPKLMSSAGITKDDLFKIAQSGLVCLEEIDNMKQRDLNQLKALTTMRTINERRSYGEFNEFHRHIASFCATGNNRFFLTDPTGNRRFLTFEVESIVPPQTYDYGYEGVYAQAYALWKQGFRYWFNDEENVEINRHNMEFEAPNKELELIQKYYRAPMEGEECKFLTATDILERINGSIKEQLSTVRIGIALRTMGIERVRSGNARGYRLVEISPEQININQRALGNFTDVNDNDDENR